MNVWYEFLSLKTRFSRPTKVDQSTWRMVSNDDQLAKVYEKEYSGKRSFLTDNNRNTK